MRFQWVLCGESDRWQRAIRYFGPRSLPSSQDRLEITPLSPLQLRKSDPLQQGIVVLWALDAFLDSRSLQHALQTLAILASDCRPMLHLIAYGELERTSSITELNLRQLGANLVLSVPEDLCRCTPSITRFWKTVQPAENILTPFTNLPCFT